MWAKDPSCMVTLPLDFKKQCPERWNSYLPLFGGFHNWGYPKIVGYGWLTIRLKWMIWGYPYFRKPPRTHTHIYIYVYIYIQYVICICMICLGMSKLSFPCFHENTLMIRWSRTLHLEATTMSTLRIPPTHRCHANISMGDLQDPTHGGTLVSTICLAIWIVGIFPEI